MLCYATLHYTNLAQPLLKVVLHYTMLCYAMLRFWGFKGGLPPSILVQVLRLPSSPLPWFPL